MGADADEKDTDSSTGKDWQALYEAQKERADDLLKQNDRLRGENTRKGKKLERFEGLPPDLVSEVTRLRGELETTKKQLVTVRHSEGFRGLLADKELGLNPAVTPEKLMKLLDYAPEGEDFDAKATRKAVLALRNSDSYLFSAPAEAEAAPARELPAWAGRGGASDVGVPESSLTENQQRDPAFMYSYGAKSAAK